MKHHLVLFEPEHKLWSRPDILPHHVFGQPEHAIAFGHTDSRTLNPESGIWFQVTVHPGDDEDLAIVEWRQGNEYFSAEVYACDAGLTLQSLVNDPYHTSTNR